MKKFFIGVTVFLCCLAAVCSGCGQNNDSGADKTAELQTKIEELQTQVSELREENDELKESVKDYKNLEYEIKDLKYVINKYVDINLLLEQKKDYKISEAYYLGLITKNDIENIAYYYNNNLEYPEALTEEEELAFKDAQAERLRNRIEHPVPDAEAEGIIINKYLGKYSGFYAIIACDIYHLHPGNVVDYWIEICGVEFHIVSNYEFINLYKIN